MPTDLGQLLRLEAEPIPEETAKLFRQWLDKPEGKLLRTLITAKCRLSEQDALMLAHKTIDSGNYSLLTDDAMKRAMHYQISLRVLEEFSDTTKPLHTVKLKR